MSAVSQRTIYRMLMGYNLVVSDCTLAWASNNGGEPVGGVGYIVTKISKAPKYFGVAVGTRFYYQPAMTFADAPACHLLVSRQGSCVKAHVGDLFEVIASVHLCCTTKVASIELDRAVHTLPFSLIKLELDKVSQHATDTELSEMYRTVDRLLTAADVGYKHHFAAHVAGMQTSLKQLFSYCIAMNN